MDRSYYFTIAAKKNALRREAGLPLVDMREEIARQQYADEIAHYNRGAEMYRAERNRIFQETLLEEQSKRGDLSSSGGRFLVARIATERFKQFLADRGYFFPKRENAIVYGDGVKT